MTSNNEVDSKIDDHRSRNQDLSLNNTEIRADPHKDDLSQPCHKVKDPILARNTTTIPRISRTTTGTTLTGPSYKTRDLRHSKRNLKLCGGNLNCMFQATDTTMIAQLVPQHTPKM
jgi:hypothetical protein